MPRIYRLSRRPVKARVVNPLLLPKTTTPGQPLPEVPESAYPADSVPLAPADQPSTDWTLAELKAVAEDKGLPSYGTKADIVERILNG
jgi:hypothetical protein